LSSLLIVLWIGAPTSSTREFSLLQFRADQFRMFESLHEEETKIVEVNERPSDPSTSILADPDDDAPFVSDADIAQYVHKAEADVPDLASVAAVTSEPYTHSSLALSTAPLQSQSEALPVGSPEYARSSSHRSQASSTFASSKPSSGLVRTLSKSGSRSKALDDGKSSTLATVAVTRSV